MWMGTYTQRLLCWGKFNWAWVVEQQEQADQRAQFGISEKRPDRKTVSHPVRTGAVQNTVLLQLFGSVA